MFLLKDGMSKYSKFASGILTLQTSTSGGCFSYLQVETNTGKSFGGYIAACDKVPKPLAKVKAPLAGMKIHLYDPHQPEMDPHQPEMPSLANQKARDQKKAKKRKEPKEPKEPSKGRDYY
eukprot:gnl/TRDRNA2_/TRDRNA2_152768_c0_seq1.p1 gnl/TRDRNA2_/TRDRNA2_152768_c0~~gnl/TRDRNA2_/TRDRNA2_152768_c0_seq1.p1  ORF type:complete len:120 (+),score=18.68 gnl/TRDRNA2_/TRDRNA2_152768_c0_seq1:148-507(+)